MLEKAIPALRFLGIGWFFAACIIGGTVGGLLLDGWLETRPIFALLGLVAGLGLAFFGGLRMVMELLASSKQENKPDA